jgi:hypothetical protein
VIYKSTRALGGSPCHHSGCGWKDSLQLWRVAVNLLCKQPWTNDKGWSSRLGVGRGAKNPSP